MEANKNQICQQFRNATSVFGKVWRMLKAFSTYDAATRLSAPPPWSCPDRPPGSSRKDPCRETRPVSAKASLPLKIQKHDNTILPKIHEAG